MRWGVSRGVCVLALIAAPLGAVPAAEAKVPKRAKVFKATGVVADDTNSNDGAFARGDQARGCAGDRDPVAPGLSWSAGDETVISALYARSLFGDIVTNNGTNGGPVLPGWDNSGARDETDAVIGEQLRMTGYVVCADVPGFQEVRVNGPSFPASQVENNSNPTRTATLASCPAGKVALGAGGGWFGDDFDSFDALTVGQIEPNAGQDPTGYEIALNSDNNGPVIDADHDAGSATITCGSNKLVLRSRKEPTTLFGDQTAHNGAPVRRTVAVRCGRGEVALGAGLDWNVSGATYPALYVSELEPIMAKKRKPVGFRITGAADEDPAIPLFFYGSVNCAKT